MHSNLEPWTKYLQALSEAARCDPAYSSLLYKLPKDGEKLASTSLSSSSDKPSPSLQETLTKSKSHASPHSLELQKEPKSPLMEPGEVFERNSSYDSFSPQAKKSKLSDTGYWNEHEDRKSNPEIAVGMEQDYCFSDKIKSLIKNIPSSYNSKNVFHNKVFGKNFVTDNAAGASDNSSKLLSDEEEKNIINWLNLCSKAGFPRKKEDLLEAVGTVVGNIWTADNALLWYSYFTDKYPNVPNLYLSYSCKHKDKILQDKVQLWFTNLKSYLHETASLNVPKFPERVFDISQIKFSIDENGNIAFINSNDSNYKSNDSSSCYITVFLSVSAAGVVIPCSVLCQSDVNLEQSVPEGWNLSSEKNSNIELALQNHVLNVFLPWIEKQSIKLPVILFLDNSKCKISNELSFACYRKGIILASAFKWLKNSFRPSDVSLIKAIEIEWPKKFKKWRKKNDSTKTNGFFAVITNILQQPMTVLRIRNAFKICGLVPLDHTVMEENVKNITDIRPLDSSGKPLSIGSVSDSSSNAKLGSYLSHSNTEAFFQQLQNISNIQQLQLLSSMMQQPQSSWALPQFAAHSYYPYFYSNSSEKKSSPKHHT